MVTSQNCEVRTRSQTRFQLPALWVCVVAGCIESVISVVTERRLAGNYGSLYN